MTIETFAKAFLAKKKLERVGNDETDGRTWRYHGNRIAEWKGNELWITTAGWNTLSTKRRLKLLGASPYDIGGVLHIDGEYWNGDWRRLK